MNNLPQHIAIVMDGNGRWAKTRGLPRISGHEAGVLTARKAVEFCAKKNIPALSLFAFSCENWQRPSEEVNFLMELFVLALERETPLLHENQVSLSFIGDRTRFSNELNTKITEVEELTKLNQKMKLLIAADYGGQWDICQAFQSIAKQVETKKMTSAEITSELIANHLSFAGIPDPDLFIRTSGEMRISNFMLWQLAYTELYFTQTLWPDFNEHEFENALLQYAKRQRRFGLSGEQLLCSNNE